MSTGESYTPINPATGEERSAVAIWNDQQIDDAIARSVHGFQTLRHTSFSQRAGWMTAAAEQLESNKAVLAALMADEMGKPLAGGRAEAEKCAWVCRYYAEHAESFLATGRVETEPGTESFVAFQPIGPVLAVMPWNFPFWQVFRFAAPALMAGNVALLKHAIDVQGCAAEIERIFREAGFPAECFLNLPIRHRGVARVIADSRVRAVTLTGSTQAGRKVAEMAGKFLKKCVLELGGSDPYLVLADADLDLAAKLCAQSRLLNSGQSCIAAKRFIVDASVHDAFLEKMIAAFRQEVVGDPHRKETTIGPLARHDLRDQLADQVEQSVEAGAKCLLGGGPPDDKRLVKGAYYLPTILSEVTPGMPAFDDELFGPVAAVIRADHEEHALELANRSPFGLGGAVFTRDKERGEQIARESIDSGSVAVNEFVKSDPRLPFGGVKDSGYGRELSSFGIREFVNIKTVTSARKTSL